MLNILIVEDEALFAQTLKYLVELNPRFQVTDIAEDFAGAMAAVERRRPDLALVDLQLARGSTGFSVAARLAERNIPCLFTSGKAPSFPIPDLALGCLVKPFTEEDLVRSLRTAEDMLRGRAPIRPSQPDRLKLYGMGQAPGAASAAAAGPAPLTPIIEPEPERAPRRRKLIPQWRRAG